MNRPLKFKYKDLNAFTLAEMMIVLMIVSIALVALLPLIITNIEHAAQEAAATDPFWTQGSTSGRSIIYYPNSETDQKLKRVIIGSDTLLANESGKISINVPSSESRSHVLFKQDSTLVGQIYSSTTSTSFGYGTAGANSVVVASYNSSQSQALSQAVAIGRSTIANDNSVAIGRQAIAHSNTVAIGNNANSTNGALVLGSADSTPSSTNSVLIIPKSSSALTLGGNVVNIASGNNTSQDYSVGITDKIMTNSDVTSIITVDHIKAVEVKSDLGGGYATTSIGGGFGESTGDIGIGYGAYAKSNGSLNIAIGRLASVSYDDGCELACIGIGYNAKYYAGSNKTQMVVLLGPYTTSYPVPPSVPTGVYSIVMGTDTSKVFVPGTLNVYESGITYPITSDIRLKNINKEYTDGFSKLNKLKIYDYTFKKYNPEEKQVGIIAQELRKVFPAAVKRNEEGILTIRSEDVLYSILNSIKYLDKFITKLKQNVDMIVHNVDEVNKKLNTLVKERSLKAQKIKKLNQEALQLEKRLAELEHTIKKEGIGYAR